LVLGRTSSEYSATTAHSENEEIKFGVIDNIRILYWGDGSLDGDRRGCCWDKPNGPVNLDIAVSADSKFLYSLNSGIGTSGSLPFRKMEHFLT